MKNVTHTANFFKVLLFVLLLSNFSASAQKTVIWVVRHAEKQAPAPDMPVSNPDLSEDGRERAKELAKVLKRENIKAIYVTSTKRSAQTARPLAAQLKILPRIYTDSIKAFVKTLLTNFNGSKVLVLAHSNTVMPILAALGAEQPLDTLSEEDFDMIFKMTIKESGKVGLEISYYGAVHHTSELPDKYRPDKQGVQQYSRPLTNY
ncbi:histidine phosphatase family protein [Mucilaginibacter sp.]|uniref:histidine phosphatase family protein n=1 Tax=Mucilaginibacter sp. TaxID=1882438 RepID=UPI0035BC0410